MNALVLMLALSTHCQTQVDDRDHWHGGFHIGTGGGWGYRPYYYGSPYPGYYNPYPYYYPYPPAAPVAPVTPVAPVAPYAAPVAPVAPVTPYYYAAPTYPYTYPYYGYPYYASPGIGLNIGWGGRGREHEEHRR